MSYVFHMNPRGKIKNNILIKKRQEIDVEVLHVCELIEFLWFREFLGFFEFLEFLEFLEFRQLLCFRVLYVQFNLDFVELFKGSDFTEFGHVS